MAKIHTHRQGPEAPEPTPTSAPRAPSTDPNRGIPGPSAWTTAERASAISAPSAEDLRTRLKELGYEPHPHMKTWWVNTKNGLWAADLHPEPLENQHWARLTVTRDLGLPTSSQWPAKHNDQREWVALGARTVQEAFRKGQEPQDVVHETMPTSESEWGAYRAGMAMVILAFKPGVFLDNPINDASQLGPEHQVKVGDWVKSYDFPGSPVNGPHGRENCYVIGTVREIVQDPERGACYAIAPESRVYSGKPDPNPSSEIVLAPVNGRPSACGAGLSQVTHGVVRLNDTSPSQEDLGAPAAGGVASAVAALARETFDEEIHEVLSALSRLDLSDGWIEVHPPAAWTGDPQDSPTFSYSGVLSITLDRDPALSSKVQDLLQAHQETLAGNVLVVEDGVATLENFHDTVEGTLRYTPPSMDQMDPLALGYAIHDPGFRAIRAGAHDLMVYLYHRPLGPDAPPVLGIPLAVNQSSTPEGIQFQAIVQATMIHEKVSSGWLRLPAKSRGPIQERTADTFAKAADRIRLTESSTWEDYAQHNRLHRLAMEARTEARGSYEQAAAEPGLPRDQVMAFHASAKTQNDRRTHHAEALLEATGRLQRLIDKADRQSEEASRKGTPEAHVGAAKAWRDVARVVPEEDLRNTAERKAQAHEGQIPKTTIPFGDTECETWFERDRAHVELRHRLTETTLIEWWDDAVAEAVEDGFLSPKDYHSSAYDYAEEQGLLNDAKAFHGWTLEVRLNEPAVMARLAMEEGYDPQKVDPIATRNSLREAVEERLRLRFPGATVRARLHSVVGDETEVAILTEGPRKQQSEAFATAAEEPVDEVLDESAYWTYDVTKFGPVELSGPPAMEYPHLRRSLLKLLERLDALTGEVPDDVKMADLRGIQNALTRMAEHPRACFACPDAGEAIKKAIQGRQSKDMDQLSRELEATNIALKVALGLDHRQSLAEIDLSVLTTHERARWTFLTDRRWEAVAGRVPPLTPREVEELARLDALLHRP